MDRRRESRAIILLAPILIAGLAIVVAVAGESASQLMRYDRAAVLDGEVWRLLTGHWVHLGWLHLLFNIAGLVLVWLLLATALRSSQWLLLTLLIALGQSTLLFALHPGIGWYVGLSGLLHGLFAAGAVVYLARVPAIAGTGLVLLGAKVAAETWGAASGEVTDWLGGPVLTESHRYGALCGALLSLPLAVRQFRRGNAHQ